MARVGTTRFAERLGVSRKAVHKAMAAQRITSWGKDDEGRIWIDEDLAAVEWARNTDPVEAAKNGKFWAVPAAIPAPAAGAQTVLEPLAPSGIEGDADAAPGAAASLVAPEKHPTTAATVTGYGADGSVDGGSAAPDAAATASGGQPAAETDYQQARTQREQANANLAQLELLERLQVLVPRADVEKAAAQAARVVRDAILAIPDRISSRLAAENDPARIYADLETELRYALNGLADRSFA